MRPPPRACEDRRVTERTRWIPVIVLLACGVAAAMMFAKVAAIFVPVREHFASGA